SIVTETVVGDRNLRCLLGNAFRANGDRGSVVFRLWSFFECVVARDDRAAIRGFDQIARCTFRTVCDRGANHFSAPCPRFDRMTLSSVGKREFSTCSKSTFIMYMPCAHAASHVPFLSNSLLRIVTVVPGAPPMIPF